jgi:multiple sugar transport system substrate-binding protein
MGMAREEQSYRNAESTGKWVRQLGVLAAGAVLFTGCSKAAEPAAEVKAEEKHDPVTIQVGLKATGYLTPEEFKRYIADPVRKRYPWITAEMVIYTTNNLPEFVVAGKTPDIIITNNVNGMPQLTELDLLTPIDDLVKKQSFDLNRFEDSAVDSVKVASQRNDLVALPYTRNFAVLYYNKDIFDKFAVPYPKDGMTWEQATGLAKQVTKLDNGIQYRGLEPNVPERLGAQLSLPLVDRKTNKSAINTEPWKKVMNQMAQIYGIPGNGSITVKNVGDELFAKTRTLAMIAEGNILFGAKLNEMTDFNWDMATIPVWPEAPKAGTSPDEHLMVLSKTSKYKEDAFRVMTAVLSEDVQLDMSKNGRTSMMRDSKIQQAYAQDLTFMKGKNIQAIFKTGLAKPYDATLYDTIVMSALSAELKNIVTKGKDVNSALRDAEEAANKKIQESIK